MIRVKSIQIIHLAQNQAIGALAIWQFTIGYFATKAEGAPLDYLYSVIPLISNSQIRRIVCHTNGGLLAYRAKLSRGCEENAILSSMEMAPYMHDLSSRAIKTALACNLIDQMNYELRFVPATKRLPQGVQLTTIENSYKKAACRLGKQMSSLTQYEVSSIFGVRF